jgi:hypothetical protein
MLDGVAPKSYAPRRMAETLKQLAGWVILILCTGAVLVLFLGGVLEQHARDLNRRDK